MSTAIAEVVKEETSVDSMRGAAGVADNFINDTQGNRFAIHPPTPGKMAIVMSEFSGAVKALIDGIGAERLTTLLLATGMNNSSDIPQEVRDQLQKRAIVKAITDAVPALISVLGDAVPEQLCKITATIIENDSQRLRDGQRSYAADDIKWRFSVAECARSIEVFFRLLELDRLKKTKAQIMS